MATKTIRIVIKQLEQDGEIYYLGRSPDLFGLTVETDTLDEMLEIAPEVATDLIDVKNERAKKENRETLREVAYQLIYEPLKVHHLQYA
jgi:predicted RNase H-like HicB family nuclease